MVDDIYGVLQGWPKVWGRSIGAISGYMTWSIVVRWVPAGGVGSMAQPFRRTREYLLIILGGSVYMETYRVENDF